MSLYDPSESSMYVHTFLSIACINRRLFLQPAREPDFHHIVFHQTLPPKPFTNRNHFSRRSPPPLTDHVIANHHYIPQLPTTQNTHSPSPTDNIIANQPPPTVPHLLHISPLPLSPTDRAVANQPPSTVPSSTSHITPAPVPH